jgi:hypothetical protein
MSTSLRYFDTAGVTKPDGEAFAILLAWMTALSDSSTYQKIKTTADHIAGVGPATTERWEEQFGQSPSSIAAIIAGLVAAADIARQNTMIAFLAHLARTPTAAFSPF